ncbi:MAG: hypothetical protein ABL931_06725 [Usitatibacteraceae bacterium]
MNSSVLLALVVLTIIAVSCFAIYMAGDAVILMIRKFGLTRTKIAAGGLGAALIGVGIFATWWYATSTREKAQNITIDSPSPLAQAAGPQPTAAAQAGDLSQLVDKLEARLKREPQDAQGLALFARTLLELKRFDAAASAYEKAVAALPSDAALHVERANAEYMARGQRWTPVAVAALQRGLKLSPDFPEALWLAGKERFENKDYANAVRHWENLQRIGAPDAEHAQDLKTTLVEARALRDGKDPAAALASAGISLTPLPSVAPPDAAPAPAGDSKAALAAELKAALAGFNGRAVPTAGGAPAAISGVVSLDAGLKSRAAPEDNVFIFARNADGAKAGIPLAVSRHRVSDLPVRFDLSDNNAMSPEAKLSTAAKVIVTARISKSGDARPQPGDLEGVSVPVALGAEKVAIVISRAR